MFVGKYRQTCCRFRIHLYRQLHRQMYHELNLAMYHDLDASLFGSLLKKLFETLFPQLFMSSFGSMFGSMYLSLYVSMDPALFRQKPGGRRPVGPWSGRQNCGWAPGSYHRLYVLQPVGNRPRMARTTLHPAPQTGV